MSKGLGNRDVHQWRLVSGYMEWGLQRRISSVSTHIFRILVSAKSGEKLEKKKRFYFLN